MSSYDDFRMAIAKRVNQFTTYPEIEAELTEIAAALDEDEGTTHDMTIVTPPDVLRIGADKSPFENEILHVVNKGRAGGLSGPDMSDAIQDVAGEVKAPEVIDTPVVSGSTSVGSTLTCTKGNWRNSPDAYAYAWKRDGMVSIGTNADTYKIVVGDSGKSINCGVTATNGAGSASAASNAIAIP